MVGPTVVTMVPHEQWKLLFTLGNGEAASGKITGGGGTMDEGTGSETGIAPYGSAFIARSKNLLLPAGGG